MTDKDLSRREFLQKTALLGVAVGASSLLAACSATEPAPGTEAGDVAGGPLDCSDISGLSETQVQTRTGLAYVEMSTTPDQNCLNCVQYQAAAEAGTCGTCTLVPGPINPEGWCSSWAAKA